MTRADQQRVRGSSRHTAGDPGEVIQAQRDPGNISALVEQTKGQRDRLSRLLVVARLHQRRPDHMQRPTLHRAIPDSTEDLQRLAELSRPAVPDVVEKANQAGAV